MGSLVLVIDRDEVERRYVSALLAADGFDVTQVERAVEGLVAITSNAPSLIILAAGRSLAADARRIGLADLVRVFRHITEAPLAIIGDPESSDEAQAFASEADFFFPRGFGAAELISRARMLTRRDGSANPSPDGLGAAVARTGSSRTFAHVAQAIVGVLTETRAANGRQAA